MILRGGLEIWLLSENAVRQSRKRQRLLSNERVWYGRRNFMNDLFKQLKKLESTKQFPNLFLRFEMRKEMF